MIAPVMRLIDGFFGRGEAAVTVPPLDGAMLPNRALDDAALRVPVADADCLAAADGRLYLSAGCDVLAERDGLFVTHRRFDTAVAALAPFAGGLAVALEDGALHVEGGRFGGARIDTGLRCITAIAAEGEAILVANGSDHHGPVAWQRDLLERGVSGSLWRIAVGTGTSERIAAGLAWPAGVTVDDLGVVVSEAWRHRIVRPGGAVLHGDLPGYPGRLAAGSGGYWMAMFAPRSQLVEFVLREPAFRRRMMAEVPEPYWIAPKLRAGRSFYESLQGGGVKQLGILKPWAPTMSAGFCVRLDKGFQPRASLQSRADGTTHGVTSAIEHAGALWAAARGDGVVVRIPLQHGEAS